MRLELDRDTVSQNEPIDRFLFDGDVRSGDSTVRGRAFMPQKSGSSAGKCSVIRTHGCLESELWDVYRRFVRTGRAQEAIGSGRILASVVYELGLGFNPDGVPHPRHANIVGWPPDKEDWKALADEIALGAVFVARPAVALTP